jgi:hypothetical protein
MTKTEIKEKQSHLAATLVEIARLQKLKRSAINALDEDIRANEAQYRNGIQTESGCLRLGFSQRFSVRQVIAKCAAFALLAATLTGCYIGKAEFKGEDMKIYPFFGTAAAPAAE